MEKDPLLPRTEGSEPRRSPSSSSSSRFSCFPALTFVAIALYVLSWRFGFGGDEEKMKTKVPLEVHIMSKCPDARDCLEKLVVPTMANVSDKVDFRLSFIGKTTEEDDGVQCMHGQTECLGNILELCAAAEYPDPKIYLGFTMCLSRDYKLIPQRSLIEDCALEHGLDFDTLNDCMSRDDGAYGMGLLRDSVTRSSDLGVKTSCTIRLDGKNRCIRDGGKWKDCADGSEPADLIDDIEKHYDEA